MEEAILDALTGNRHQPGTHAHIIGASASGKSRFIESLIRKALYRPAGFCLIDWHGNLYDGILNYLAFHQSNHRDIYLLDPATGDFVTPYNPFKGEAPNPVAAANSYLNALAKAWGSQDTNATPRIEQIARILFLTAVVSGESLQNVSLLLRREHADVRRWAWRLLSKPEFLFVREELQSLSKVDATKWDDHVSSTLRRLGRLLADPAISRFLALQENSLDLRKLMDSGAIILVNLADRDFLDRESAKAFASLLLADFFRVAMRRSVEDFPEPFILFMDEFQEYLTPDSPKMLEGIRKGGLHLVMAHQHLDQLEQPQVNVRASILQNARIKVCFAQGDTDSAKFMAEQLFIHELNENKIKDEVKRWETIGHTLEKHPTQTWGITYSNQDSHSVGHWDGEETPRSTETAGAGESVTGTIGTALLLRPILEHNVSSRTFYALEEKLSLLAEKLLSLDGRQCFIRFFKDIPVSYFVPEIRRFVYDDWNREEYAVDIFEKIGAVTPSEADAIIARSRDEFLKKIAPPPKPKKAPKKAPDTKQSSPPEKPF